MEDFVSSGKVISVREVYKELDGSPTRQHLREWIKINRKMFEKATAAEVEMIAEIFSLSHFQQLISKKQTLRAGPVADPFVIAAAGCRDGCVVTEEKWKKNAAKIPNVCEHFGIECRDLEGFLFENNWKF